MNAIAFRRREFTVGATPLRPLKKLIERLAGRKSVQKQRVRCSATSTSHNLSNTIGEDRNIMAQEKAHFPMPKEITTDQFPDFQRVIVTNTPQHCGKNMKASDPKRTGTQRTGILRTDTLRTGTRVAKFSARSIGSLNYLRARTIFS